MNSFSEKYISVCCPHLAASEVACVYEHIDATFKSTDLVHADDVRTIARQLFPYVKEQYSPADIDRANSFRLAEALADLEAGQKMLRKIQNPSDDVAMALRDLGLVIELLGGGE
tara:strand:- start:102 stop:443 length:342 start_codon:yes stop_codon:yes gene_type:complete